MPADNVDAAFDQFRFWRSSGTLLRLTVLTEGGEPERYVRVVAAIDQKATQVGFMERRRSIPLVIDFSGASFTVGRRVLEAARPNGDRVVCEEVQGT
jgi:hypothetical protein